MEKPLLNDENEYPDDDVLSKYLKKNKNLWDDFMNTISSDFPVLSLEWKYYKDGKSWLCKLTKKKKTICWISIWDGFFKITFYFTDKNIDDIKNLNIDQNLKDIFATSKKIGKLKPLTTEITTKRILKNIYELINYKQK